MAEAMTTPNDKQQPKQQGIRVREIRFCRPNGLEVPVPGGDHAKFDQLNSIREGVRDGDWNVTIELQPWVRRYRIEYAHKTQKPIAYSIHETWALHVE